MSLSMGVAPLSTAGGTVGDSSQHLFWLRTPGSVQIKLVLLTNPFDTHLQIVRLGENQTCRKCVWSGTSQLGLFKGQKCHKWETVVLSTDPGGVLNSLRQPLAPIPVTLTGLSNAPAAPRHLGSLPPSRRCRRPRCAPGAWGALGWNSFPVGWGSF